MPMTEYRQACFHVFQWSSRLFSFGFWVLGMAHLVVTSFRLRLISSIRWASNFSLPSVSDGNIRGREDYLACTPCRRLFRRGRGRTDSPCHSRPASSTLLRRCGCAAERVRRRSFPRLQGQRRRRCKAHSISAPRQDKRRLGPERARLPACRENRWHLLLIDKGSALPARPGRYLQKPCAPRGARCTEDPRPTQACVQASKEMHRRHCCGQTCAARKSGCNALRPICHRAERASATCL